MRIFEDPLARDYPTWKSNDHSERPRRCAISAQRARTLYLVAFQSRGGYDERGYYHRLVLSCVAEKRNEFQQRFSSDTTSREVERISFVYTSQT